MAQQRQQQKPRRRLPLAPGPGMIWDDVHQRWVKPGQDAPFETPTRFGPGMWDPWLTIDPEGEVWPFVAPPQPDYHVPGWNRQNPSPPLFFPDPTDPSSGAQPTRYLGPDAPPPTPGPGGSTPWFDPDMMQQTGGSQDDTFEGPQMSPNPNRYRPWRPWGGPGQWGPYPIPGTDPTFTAPYWPTDLHPSLWPLSDPAFWGDDVVDPGGGGGDVFEDPQNPGFGDPPPQDPEVPVDPDVITPFTPHDDFEASGSIDPMTPKSAARDWAVAPSSPMEQPKPVKKAPPRQARTRGGTKGPAKRPNKSSSKPSRSVGRRGK